MEVRFVYRDDHGEEYVAPMVERLRETETFAELERLAVERGHGEIEVFTFEGIEGGVATYDVNGRALIGIDVSHVMYSQSARSGFWPPDGPYNFSRPIPQSEMFVHELAHIALGHPGDSAVDLALGGIALNEEEAIEFTNRLRDELGLPLRVEYSFDGRADGYYPFDPEWESECFLSSTPISTLSGSSVPIERVRPGDVVQAYDRSGDLVPGTVTRVFTNRVRQILDVFGLFVTPGHATLCGEGRHAGRHVPMIDILRTDGALVAEDGSLVRAGTGCPVGSAGDRLLEAVAGVQEPGGRVRVLERGRVRAGTRVIAEGGHDVSVLELIEAMGAEVTEEGLVRTGEGRVMPYFWSFTPGLPKPEDYVLARSGTSLSEIYAAGEWEAAAPMTPYEGPRAAEASVNVPLALREAAH